MRLGELRAGDIAARLAGPGVALDLGPVRVRVRSDAVGLPDALASVYGEFPVTGADGFFEVTATVKRVPGLRRLVRPQIRFFVDGETPFDPFPADTHLPLLEWGLNWCLASFCNQFLLLHAGAVERDGKAVLLPAQPGSGKSTLTAALVCSGYRLLSDEFGVVRLEEGSLLPLLRPVALKNESIGAIRQFSPTAVIGPTFPRTRKGTVAHLAPDRHSVDRGRLAAQPTLVVFPKYVRGAAVTVEEVPPARAFTKLAGNSFNYDLLGPAAFDGVREIVERCKAVRLEYGELSEGVDAVGRLLAG